MHVLILPSWYFAAGSQEIKGRMFHQHAKALRKRGMDACILFADLNPVSPFRQVINRSDEEGVPTWRMRQWFLPKIHPLLIRLWIKKYIKFIQGYIEKEGRPDVIHAHSYFSGAVAAAIFRKTAIPFIVTERLSSFITDRIPAQYKPYIKQTFDDANQITCVSPGLKMYLQRYTSKNIEIVPNFFDPSIFYQDPLIRKNEIFTLISVGEPSKVKGLDILIHAFGSLRKKLPLEKIQLIMIDHIKEKEELMLIANDYQVADEITWTGLISQTEIADILRKGHAFVSASKVETFGKSILEAQACGLPVVATQTDGAGYILNSPDQGILVANNDIDQLTDALHEMFMNYRRYNAGKIITSVATFREEIVMEQWLEIYRKVGA